MKRSSLTRKTPLKQGTWSRRRGCRIFPHPHQKAVAWLPTKGRREVKDGMSDLNDFFGILFFICAGILWPSLAAHHARGWMCAALVAAPIVGFFFWMMAR